MHQRPRPSPVTASPANSPRTNPARTNNPRDQEREPRSPPPDEVFNNMKGLGIEQGTEMFEQGQAGLAPGKDAIYKLNQIVQNYHTKAALIILHSRVDLPPAFSRGSDVKKVNKWFNVELDDTDVMKDDINPWRSCDIYEHRPPPLVIETYLNTSDLTSNQSLVIIDDQGKRWDVAEALATLPAPGNPAVQQKRDNAVILERWQIELGEIPETLPADLASILPTVYKKSIVLFRSLFTHSKFLPAWKFTKRQSKLHPPALRLRYRIFAGTGSERHDKLDNLTVPLCSANGQVVDTYSFGATESPAGPFSIHVTYRTNCEFRVDDSEALLSSRFMGADDNLFRPSLPSQDVISAREPEVSSLPERYDGVEQPHPGQAYGSLSTFHQVAPTTGTSPMTALRAAGDLASSSPRSSAQPLVSPKLGRAARLISGDGGGAMHRRPSVSFQPFKAPVLSASPSLWDYLPGSSPQTASRRRSSTMSDRKQIPNPENTACTPQRTAQVAAENAIASSTSASPKTSAPISKYTSSFSHRRGRLSSGGASKTDDENTSSGRGSTSSSAVQPNSGVIPDAAVPSSAPRDEDGISTFIKLIDSKKDLFDLSDATTIGVSTRRTSAALARFQKMKDSNVALSESMSSSMIIQRSSASFSRQIPGVHTAAAANSLSTSTSPGKPISPYAPHTPAVPSRLSSNSIVEYNDLETIGEKPRHQLSHESRASTSEDTSGEETANEPSKSSKAAAIDIPTSPRPYIPNYPRSSSAIQRKVDAPIDEDLGPFVPVAVRSASLGAEERSPISAEPRTHGRELDRRPPEAVQEPAGPNQPQQPKGKEPRDTKVAKHTEEAGLGESHELGVSASGGIERGGLQHMGKALHDSERGEVDSRPNSTAVRDSETGRSFRPRLRGNYRYQPPSSSFDEDEPLLFAMSDYSVPRRSLEETQPRSGTGSGTASGQPPATSGSGRGGNSHLSGGRSFHAWP